MIVARGLGRGHQQMVVTGGSLLNGLGVRRQIAVVPQPTVMPYAGPMVFKKRRDEDDDVLLFMLRRSF